MPGKSQIISEIEKSLANKLTLLERQVKQKEWFGQDNKSKYWLRNKTNLLKDQTLYSLRNLDSEILTSRKQNIINSVVGKIKTKILCREKYDKQKNMSHDRLKRETGKEYKLLVEKSIVKAAKEPFKTKQKNTKDKQIITESNEKSVDTIIGKIVNSQSKQEIELVLNNVIKDTPPAFKNNKSISELTSSTAEKLWKSKEKLQKTKNNEYLKGIVDALKKLFVAVGRKDVADKINEKLVGNWVERASKLVKNVKDKVKSHVYKYKESKATATKTNSRSL